MSLSKPAASVGRGRGITVKVANNWPETCRQELQWQRADFKGKEVRGRDKSCLKRPQWHEAWRWIEGQAAVMAVSLRMNTADCNPADTLTKGYVEGNLCTHLTMISHLFLPTYVDY